MGFIQKTKITVKLGHRLIAKTFNSKYIYTAYSGIGITRDGSGDTNNIYTKRYDEIIPFDKSTAIVPNRSTSLVIIGLGANDLFPESQGKQKLDSSYFCKAYSKFITKIRKILDFYLVQKTI